MHHCDVLCLVISFFVCSLQAYNYTIDYTEHLYFCALNSSPPTHFTRAQPSPAKNRYLNSRLMILHASELATELFDEVQSPRCTSIATAKLPARGRVTCMVLRNTKWRLTFSKQRVVIVKSLV